ncbi:MAG TPA: oligosaccharide flippase family protein [Acidobacteriaceae bacterium]|nr:oligosaccharide flippase family protein [Acidobacteriaceae bacterium]
MSETVVKDSPKKLYSVRKLALGSTLRVIHLVLLTVVGFALTPFIVHTLGTEQYGLWTLANAFVGFYGLLDLGLSGAVFTRMSHALGAGDHETGTRVYATGLRLFGGLGGILIFATICLSVGVLMLHQNHSRMMAAVLLIIGIHTAISFMMRPAFGVLTAGSHFEMVSSVLIFSLILRAVGTVLVLRAGKGVLGLAIINLLSWAPGYIFICLAVHWQYPFIRVRDLTKWHRETAKGLLTFGVPVLIGQTADRIRLQMDAVVVSLFLGLSAVAHYNVATTLVMYYMDGIVAIIGVLAPVMAMQTSAKDLEGMRRSLFMGTRLGLCSAGFAGFGLIAWGRVFISRWMGPQFIDAYPVLVILTLAMFLDLVQSTTVNALYAGLHVKTYAKINVAEAIANLMLSLALAPRYGMIGIALGTLIPAGARLFIQPFVVREKLNLRVAEYFIACLKASWKTALFLVLPTLITMRWLRPTYPSMFLVGGISLIAFALPIWYFEFGGAGWHLAVSRLKPLMRLGRDPLNCREF